MLGVCLNRSSVHNTKVLYSLYTVYNLYKGSILCNVKTIVRQINLIKYLTVYFVLSQLVDLCHLVISTSGWFVSVWLLNASWLGGEKLGVLQTVGWE